METGVKTSAADRGVVDLAKALDTWAASPVCGTYERKIPTCIILVIMAVHSVCVGVCGGGGGHLPLDSG